MSEEKKIPAYDEIVRQVHHSLPHLADILKRAHDNRSKLLNERAKGIRFEGLNEWIGHLKILETIFADPRIHTLKFLVVRTRSNYEAAIEATLSGLPSVVFDSMRDVMEVDLLLQDFVANPSNINLWLNANNRTLMDIFAPKHLRKRKAERLGLTARNQLPDTRDYDGHSHALHVQPVVYPHERRGLVELGHPVFDDFCFWEMLGHARSIAETINSLLREVATEFASADDLKTRLPKLTHAHKQVLEYSEIMNGLARAAASVKGKRASD